MPLVTEGTPEECEGELVQIHPHSGRKVSQKTRTGSGTILPGPHAKNSHTVNCMNDYKAWLAFFFFSFTKCDESICKIVIGLKLFIYFNWRIITLQY